MSASNLEVVTWFPGVTVCLLSAADLQGQQSSPTPTHTPPANLCDSLLAIVLHLLLSPGTSTDNFSPSEPSPRHSRAPGWWPRAQDSGEKGRGDARWASGWWCFCGGEAGGWDWESNQAAKGGERESKTEGGKQRERRSLTVEETAGTNFSLAAASVRTHFIRSAELLSKEEGRQKFFFFAFLYLFFPKLLASGRATLSITATFPCSCMGL